MRLLYQGVRLLYSYVPHTTRVYLRDRLIIKGTWRVLRWQHEQGRCRLSDFNYPRATLPVVSLYRLPSKTGRFDRRRDDEKLD